MPEVTAGAFRDSVFNAFDTAWADETEIAAPNKQFITDGKAEFVRLYLLGNAEGQRLSNSVLTNFWIRSGIMTIQIYVRQDTDTDRAYVLAEKALLWLENPGVAQAIFTSRSAPVETGSDGTWFLVTVSADFQYFTDRAA